MDDAEGVGGGLVTWGEVWRKACWWSVTSQGRDLLAFVQPGKNHPGYMTALPLLSQVDFNDNFDKMKLGRESFETRNKRWTHERLKEKENFVLYFSYLETIIFCCCWILPLNEENGKNSQSLKNKQPKLNQKPIRLLYVLLYLCSFADSWSLLVIIKSTHLL